jgi:hypothetical protein
LKQAHQFGAVITADTLGAARAYQVGAGDVAYKMHVVEGLDDGEAREVRGREQRRQAACGAPASEPQPSGSQCSESRLATPVVRRGPTAVECAASVLLSVLLVFCGVGSAASVLRMGGQLRLTH